MDGDPGCIVSASFPYRNIIRNAFGEAFPLGQDKERSQIKGPWWQRQDRERGKMGLSHTGAWGAS